MKSLFYLLPLILIFTACSPVKVQPWEKETLAKETMSEGGTNLLLKQYEEHIYFSKEATKGGAGVAGGGCGCN
jgi:hypothetical protein